MGGIEEHRGRGDGSERESDVQPHQNYKWRLCCIIVLLRPYSYSLTAEVH